MGFFSSIFDWFKGFFSVVAKTAIGIAAESIKDTALEIVENVETNSGKQGIEKFNIAKETLTKKYPSMKEAAINLAIEAAVAIIKDKKDG